MTRRRILAAPLLVAVSLAVVWFSCRRSVAVDADPAQKEAELFLTRYLQIDTTNPPGNETAAARYLQEIFTREGIPAQLVGDNPARMSVVARLRSGTNAPALVLLHHLDVVPADARAWTVPPFSGRISGGYIWGRGALDIKSLGVAWMIAMLDLKRANRPLARDVIFVGTADEELGGEKGVGALVRDHPEIFQGAGFVLTEGGANETIVDRVSFWGIEVEQKVPLWIRLSTRGRPSHSAVPPGDGGSAAALIEILARIQARPEPERLLPGVERSFAVLAQAKKGEKAEVLGGIRQFVGTPRLNVLSPGYRALLRNTVAITRLEAGTAVNAMPAVSSAWLDFRLLPDVAPEQYLDGIRRLAGSRAEIEVVLQAEPAPASPVDTELFRTIARSMKRAEPQSVVGPLVGAGTSDARFFRSRGLVAYGVSPFKVNYYDADTVHGRDERIRTNFFHEGVGLAKEIVRGFCVAPGT